VGAITPLGNQDPVNFVSRTRNFLERVNWLSPIASGPWSALVFWLSASRDPSHVARGTYLGTPVSFRGIDAMAIKEVLVDREYAFAVDRIAHLASPTVLDVGAHIGLFALAVLKAIPSARAQSVEADPETYRVLLSNIADARSQGSEWKAVHAAAWSTDCDAVRFFSVGPSMSHRVSSKGNTIVEGISLKSLLDGFVGGSGIVDLLKVDIEGSEEAFLCAEPSLLKRARNLVVELHPNFCDTSHVEKVLRDSYQIVKEVHGRSSSKPLLLCY
jgi:FkbM family methyltransferase